MCKTPGKHYASRVNHQLLVVLSLLGVCVALFIANRPRMDVVAVRGWHRGGDLSSAVITDRPLVHMPDS